MNSDEEAEMRTHAIEFHRFIEFLESVGVKLKCELCGSEGFGIRTHIDGTHVPVLTFLDETGETKPSEIHIGYYQAVCENCGNTKLFEKSVMDQWDERNRNG